VAFACAAGLFDIAPIVALNPFAHAPLERDAFVGVPMQVDAAIARSAVHMKTRLLA